MSVIAIFILTYDCSKAASNIVIRTKKKTETTVDGVKQAIITSKFRLLFEKVLRHCQIWKLNHAKLYTRSEFNHRFKSIYLFMPHIGCKLHLYTFHTFHNASAFLAMQGIRLSVRLSRSDVLSRGIKIRSCGLQRQVWTIFSGEVISKFYPDIRRKSCPAKALK